MLIIKSFPAPFFKKTANGASNIEIIINSNLLSMILASNL